MTHTLPDLEYDYDALAPTIDAETMEIHHSKHHQKYVDKLNEALDKHPEFKEKDVISLLKDIDAIPEDIRTAVRNHGGGHANHSLFWKIIGPEGSEPAGDLAVIKAINETFSDMVTFKNALANAALGRFGSGWAWLAVDGNGTLQILSTPNQDSPLMDGYTPILGIDVWEHAYYLTYRNKRPDYVEAFWKIVNWSNVDELYTDAIGGM